MLFDVVNLLARTGLQPLLTVLEERSAIGNGAGFPNASFC